MTALPANINIAHARLPETYERAKTALAECTRIDECMDWANKAEALASYAKQADDDTLRKHADRIQARAVRRCGELLKTFQTGASGGRPKNEAGADPVSQKDAGSRVGMSERQIKTAVRVANVLLADLLKELAAPISRDEKVEAAIARAARLSGIPYNRVFNIWYGKARWGDTHEHDAVVRAVDEKRRREARNELHELKTRIAIMESRLNQMDADFYRETIDELRLSLRPTG